MRDAYARMSVALRPVGLACGRPASAIRRCNAFDDDCDGNVDEGLGLVQAALHNPNGCTATGILTCDLSSEQLVCDAASAAPTAETCDGLDNDCDGIPDEDFPNQRCCTEAYHCPPSQTCISNRCNGSATNQAAITTRLVLLSVVHVQAFRLRSGSELCRWGVSSAVLL